MKILLVITLLCILAASASAIPLNTCQTISTPGSYTVTRDLFSTNTCLTINTSNVHIDGNGYTISSDYPQRSGQMRSGITTAPFQAYTNISITNTTIRGFSHAGIKITATQHAHIDNVSIITTVLGIDMHATSDSSITRATIHDSRPGGYAIRMTQARNNILNQIDITNNFLGGIMFGQTDNITSNSIAIVSPHANAKGIELITSNNTALISTDINLDSHNPALNVQANSKDVTLSKAMLTTRGNVVTFSENSSLTLESATLLVHEQSKANTLKSVGNNPGRITIKHTTIGRHDLSLGNRSLIIDEDHIAVEFFGPLVSREDSLDALLTIQQHNVSLHSNNPRTRITFRDLPQGGFPAMLCNGLICTPEQAWFEPILDLSDTFIADVFAPGSYEIIAIPIINRPGTPEQ